MFYLIFSPNFLLHYIFLGISHTWKENYNLTKPICSIDPALLTQACGKKKLQKQSVLMIAGLNRTCSGYSNLYLNLQIWTCHKVHLCWKRSHLISGKQDTHTQTLCKPIKTEFGDRTMNISRINKCFQYKQRIFF